MICTAATTLLLVFIGQIAPADSFSRPSFVSARRQLNWKIPERILQTRTAISMVGDLIADMAVTVGSPDYHTSGIVLGDKVLDQNGKEFTVGCVVRVCTDGLKAFQINAKGQGSFGSDKKFVPDVSDSGKKKFLLLPIGLRGTVTKVYDESVVSANLPVQVKFVSGEHTEEGYDTPSTFLMHFMPTEVECI
jgi:hypothetical protein